MIVAFILATTKSGKEQQVIDNLKNFKEVEEAWNVYGDYDILVKVGVENLDKLNDFLLKEVRKETDISTTTTMIAL